MATTDERELREFVLAQRELNDADWLGLREGVSARRPEQNQCAPGERLLTPRQPTDRSWKG